MNRGFTFYSALLVIMTTLALLLGNFNNVYATSEINPLKANLDNNGNHNNGNHNNGNGNDASSSSNDNNNNGNHNNGNGNDASSSSNDNNNNGNGNHNNGNGNDASSSSNDNNNNGNGNNGKNSKDTPLKLPFNSNIADQSKEKSYSDTIPFP